MKISAFSRFFTCAAIILSLFAAQLSGGERETAPDGVPTKAITGEVAGPIVQDGLPSGVEIPNLLVREDFSDTGHHTVQLVMPGEYAEIELFGNLIRIPEGALDEILTVALAIPNCPYILYITFPSGVEFGEEVTLEFSYDHADLNGVDEESIVIYRFDKSIWDFEFLGGEVDTLRNVVTVDISEFPPPGAGDGLLVRYVLADE